MVHTPSSSPRSTTPELMDTEPSSSAPMLPESKRRRLNTDPDADTAHDADDEREASAAGSSTTHLSTTLWGMPASSLSSASDEVEFSLDASPTASSDTWAGQVSASKISNIFVRCQVDIATHVIEIFINSGQRPDTLFDHQGDHISSYYLIIIALLESASNDIGGAIDSIKKLAHILLEPGIYKQFEIIKNQKLPEQHILTHDKRIQARTFLEEHDSDLAKEVNRQLKYAKKQALANYLTELTNTVLQGTQRHILASEFSKGRQNKDPLEGVKTKRAAWALMALDQICHWRNQPETFFDEETVDEIINSLSKNTRNTATPTDEENQHLLRYGITALATKEGEPSNDGVRADNLKRQLIENRKNPEKIKEIFEKLPQELYDVNKVATYIGNLYDYQHKLEFNLSLAFPLAKKTVAFKDKTNEDYWMTRLLEHFPKEENEIVINDTTATITRTQVDILIQTLHRHFSIVETAFPRVVTYGDYQAIKDLFMKNTVLEQQKWGVQTVPPKGNPLSRDYLKGKLADLATAKPTSPSPEPVSSTLSL